MTFDLNAYQLADRADCGTPDKGHASPGARFLLRIQDAVNEALEWASEHDEDVEADEMAHDIADNAVPIYTHEKWLTFVDLAAWQEDLDWGMEHADMDEASNLALYAIARRLAEALFTECADINEEDSE